MIYEIPWCLQTMYQQVKHKIIIMHDTIWKVRIDQKNIFN